MKVVRADGAVVVILSDDEAEHLGHRLNVSSSKSFADYRVGHGIAGLPRHPFADDFISGLAEINICITEEDC